MEDDLRDMMHARAENIRPTGDPVAKVRERRDIIARRRTARRSITSIAAVAAVVVAIGVPLWLVHGLHGPTQPAVSSTSTPTTAPTSSASPAGCPLSAAYLKTKSGTDAGGPYKQTVLRLTSVAKSLCVFNPGDLKISPLLPDGRLGPNGSAFLWGTWNGPQHPPLVTLAPGDTYDITLQWTPSSVGRCLGPATLAGFQIAFAHQSTPTIRVQTPSLGFCKGDDLFLKLPRLSGQPAVMNDGSITPGPGLDAATAAARALQGLGDPSVATLDVTGMSVEIHMQAGQADDLRTEWLGYLLEGAVADLMRTDQATTSDVIDGGEILFPNPNGGDTKAPLGYGAVVGGQVFNSPSDAVLTAHVKAVASSHGLTVKSLRILHPLDSAIEVTLVVPDALTPTWTASTLSADLEGSPRQVEGIYLQLDSPSGQKLLATYGAYRMGSGGLWCASDQYARFGVQPPDTPVPQPTS